MDVIRRVLVYVITFCTVKKSDTLHRFHLGGDPDFICDIRHVRERVDLRVCDGEPDGGMEFDVTGGAVVRFPRGGTGAGRQLASAGLANDDWARKIG